MSPQDLEMEGIFKERCLVGDEETALAFYWVIADGVPFVTSLRSHPAFLFFFQRDMDGVHGDAHSRNLEGFHCEVCFPRS
jgi:hypothetical protein